MVLRSQARWKVWGGGGGEGGVGGGWGWGVVEGGGEGGGMGCVNGRWCGLGGCGWMEGEVLTALSAPSRGGCFCSRSSRSLEERSRSWWKHKEENITDTN